MKSTGMTRRIDELGRIVIPSEIRKNFNIKEGDQLEVFAGDGEITLRKYRNRCACCGSDELEVLREVKGLRLCADCVGLFNETK